MCLSKHHLRKSFVTLNIHFIYITCLIMLVICLSFNSRSQSTRIVDKAKSFQCHFYAVIYLFSFGVCCRQKNQYNHGKSNWIEILAKSYNKFFNRIAIGIINSNLKTTFTG